MVDSILLPQFHGSFFITGQRGMGKSMLAVQVERPELTAFFDFDEEKGRTLHDTLRFGAYYPVTTMVTGKSQADVWYKFQELVGKLPSEITTVVLDNTGPLEAGMYAHVLAHASEMAKLTGISEKNISTGGYGAGRGVVNFLISKQISTPLHARGVKLIIATAHVKPKWQGNGKMDIKGADRWHEIGSLTLVLIPQRSGPPFPRAAIVQKEALGLISFDPETLEYSVVAPLPPRLPKATFAEIRRYMQQPVDWANLKDEEQLLPSEIEPFTDELSKDQIAFMRAQAESELLDKQLQLKAMSAEAENPFNVSSKNEEEATARKLLAEGMSVDEVVKTTGLPKVIVKGLQA